MSVKLISIEEARDKILSKAVPLSVESRPLTEALGYVLCEDLAAPHNVPPFDNAAMDGFALHAADAGGAGEDRGARLEIVDTIAAGRVATGTLSRGQAARIMTGAPLPPGADAVVQVEVTEESGGAVLVYEAAKPGRNIRRAGEDVKAGDVVLGPGSILGPAEIGLAASLGYPTVRVHRRPRVAIVSTGSELVEVGRPLGPGQIYNSNGYSLRALCQESGVEPTVLGVVADDYEATKRLMAEGLEYDVLLTSGGVSVGRFDFVRDLQDELGVERLLWGIAMKPGKPLAFGVRGRTLVFGLPGNPVSAMVSFEMFVRPALLRLMGRREVLRPLYKAVIAEDLAGGDGRTYIVRVRAWREGNAWHATSTGPQGSGILRSMVGANGLVFIPADRGSVRAGEEVDFILLRENLAAS